MSGIGVKWMFLWCFDILWKLHAWGKNLVLKLGPKMAQYSLIVIISLVDWYLTFEFLECRLTWMIGAMFISSFFFLEKFSFGQMAHFGSEKRQIFVTLGLIKCLFRANGPFWIEKSSILITLDWFEEFFL